jgi:tetratricopeptide (TPR) repeat protein
MTPFRPNIDDALIIDGTAYRVAAHPAAPGMPYGQTGRRATVYQLLGGAPQALKVFTPAFRTPRTAQTGQRLAHLASLPGLQVCARTTITPQFHAALLRQHADLSYAVLMPWIAGETWQELVLDQRQLTADQCHALAQALAAMLAAMESQGIAHCDLSASNLLLTDASLVVTLVDVEDLYAPGLERPEKPPGGSPGYAHATASAGLWSPTADRFAGAVLLAEILGWCDERVRRASANEQFFDPLEMQQPSERYRQLLGVLRSRWGLPLADAFAEAWNSVSLEACPPLAGWAELLGVSLPPASSASFSAAEKPVQPAQERLARATVERAAALLELGEADRALVELAEAHHLAPAIAGEPYAHALLSRGSAYEHAGELGAALADYVAARDVAPVGALRNELDSILTELASRSAQSQLSALPYCPGCRREMQAEWVRCPYCETLLGQPTETQSYLSKIDTSRRRAPIWLVALVAFILIIGVGGAGLITNRTQPALTPQPLALAALPTATTSATAAPTTTTLPAATATVLPTSTLAPTATAIPPTATPNAPTATLKPPTTTPNTKATVQAQARATAQILTKTTVAAQAARDAEATAVAAKPDLVGWWNGTTAQGKEITFYVSQSGENRFYFGSVSVSFTPQQVISGTCSDLRLSNYGMNYNDFIGRDFDVNVRNSNNTETNIVGMRGRFDTNKAAHGSFYIDFVFDSCRATAEIPWQASR